MYKYKQTEADLQKEMTLFPHANIYLLHMIGSFQMHFLSLTFSNLEKQCHFEGHYG